jgi:tetratricopeptide (TPR) repeat protein
MNFLRPLLKLFESKPPELNKSHILNAVMLQAKHAYYAEDFKHAFTLYTEAQKLTDKHPSLVAKIDLYLQWAEVLIANKQYEDASSLLDKAQHLAEEQQLRMPIAYALILRGVSAQAQTDYDGAQEHYEHARKMGKLVRSMSAEGRAMIRLGQLSILQNSLTYGIHLLREGILMLQRIGDTEPLGWAFAYLGLALMQSEKEIEGRTVLGNAVTHALDRRDICLLRTINLAVGHYNLMQKDYSNAYTHFNNSLKLFPFAERIPQEYHQTQLYAVYCAVKLNKLDDAKDLHTRMLNAISPNTPTQHFDEITIMGSLLAYAEQNIQAALLSSKASIHKFAPDNQPIFVLDVWVVYLRCSRQLSSFADALEAHQQAIQVFQASALLPRFYVELGELYASKRQRQQALDSYTQGIKVAESLKDLAYAVLFNAKIGVLEAELGQGKTAIKRLENVLLQLNSVRDHDIRAQVHEYVADVYADTSERANASNFCQLALEHAKKSNDPHAESRLRAKLAILTLEVPETAITELTLARQQSRVLNLTVQEIIQESWLGVAYRKFQDINTALTHHYHAIAHLDYATYPEETALLQLHLADTLIETPQDLSQTANHYQNALNAAEQSDNILLQHKAHLGLATLEFRQEQLALASERLHKIESALLKTHHQFNHLSLRRLQSKLYEKLGDESKHKAMVSEISKLELVLGLVMP